MENTRENKAFVSFVYFIQQKKYLSNSPAKMKQLNEKFGNFIQIEV